MLTHRRQMTDEFGAGTMDVALATLRCSICTAEIADPTLRTMVVPYADLEQLQERAAGMGIGEVPGCEACEGSGELVHLDYHAYHAARGQDLVLRITPLEGVALFWWAPDSGHVPFDELSEDDARGFRLSACARAAAIAPMLEGGTEDLVQVVEQTLAEAGGDPLLLDVIPPLLGAGRAGLCARIAEVHQHHHPDDARGHYWMAEVMAQCINAGAIALEAIPEVRAHLHRAFELDPSLPAIYMTQATLDRLVGDEAAARVHYEKVLELDPARVEALYNLAVMDLEHDPARALERFQQGATHVPEDPDYPLGCARALVRLDRLDEAKTWLERGRELAPEHPRIEEIEGALG